MILKIQINRENETSLLRYDRLMRAEKRREFVYCLDAQKPEFSMHRALSEMDVSGV